MTAITFPAARAPRVAFSIPERAAMRALNSYVKDEETGCHVSTYSTASHGYAQIGWLDRSKGTMRGTTAHRAAWTAIHGPIPEGMTIDHTCHNRRCVNVDHLRMLTNFENARRTSGRDWPLGECINGHGPECLHQQRSGKIVCRACVRDCQARYRAARRAARASA